jgi:hypothetical protein
MRFRVAAGPGPSLEALEPRCPLPQLRCARPARLTLSTRDPTTNCYTTSHFRVAFGPRPSLQELGTTFSAPAITVRSTGEADVVAQGRYNELVYYHAIPGGNWSVNVIAGAETTFSKPAITVRSTGEADIVAQSPNNELLYYYAFPGGNWTSTVIAGSGTTFSAPSISVQAYGEADVVAGYWSSSVDYLLGDSRFAVDRLGTRHSITLVGTLGMSVQGTWDCYR